MEDLQRQGSEAGGDDGGEAGRDRDVLGARHVPVLLHEVVEGLHLSRGDVVLDATLGDAGHARELCAAVAPDGTLVGIDQDTDALARAKKALRDAPCEVRFIHSNFRKLSKKLREQGVEKLDGALFDLGMSSDQLETSGRGFTFRRDEPLLMTMDPTAELTAQQIVNFWPQADIERILREHGEESFARMIAEGIVRARQTSPIATTFELVAAISDALPARARRGKRHFATKTFQAIRMAVNDELEAEEEGLREAWGLLRPGKRLAVITFHSLEDRIAKNFFKDKQVSGECILITKKPVVASRVEQIANPRSRSAKLRIGEKNEI